MRIFGLRTTTAALTIVALTAPASAHAAATPMTVAAKNTVSTSTVSKGTVDTVPVCAPAKKGQFTCFALRRTDVAGTKGILRDAVPSGYGPTDLASAYNLPGGGGAGATIAIVDAFDDPNAEADLAVYRAQYGLPACTTANGCFTKVDQTGGTAYPPADTNWATEISLDLDLVSAAAPAAHIILVEGNTPNFTDLGAAVDEAVALGAGYVSNSYGTNYNSTPGSGEDPSETTTLDAYYNHPGVAVVAGAGDSGYGVSYPAASQYVTAVGGTSLAKDSSTRGWSESVWNNSHGATGSGCSLYEPKPAFQADTGCTMRTVADVAADADPVTGVAVYDSYQSSGWGEFGGTSAATPLITGVYADAGAPAAGTYPNSYPYTAPGSLNDVTSGSDGTCSTAYLCNAQSGYDGPTGLGTPNGTAAFAPGPHGILHGTVTDATTGAKIAGVKVAISSGASTSGSTITGPDGTYSISVSPGTYTVTASAYGYATSVVSSVTVNDKQTITENFALAAVARVTLSGVVTDGSGKGWPLYSSITVDGTPGGPIFTNPRTGAYSLQLPVNATYTLHVTAEYPGYQPAVQQVVVGTSAVVQNIAVPIDTAACDAPGYALNHRGAFESFDTTSTPAGWTIANAANTVGGWAFNDPGGRGNLTGGSGGFAIVDSDFYGQGNSQDTQLISPVVDLSSQTAPAVAFDTYFKPYSTSVGDVDLSLDGGVTWANVSHYTSSTVAGHQKIELAQAAGKNTVRIRFHYTGTWAFYWQLDNVLLGTDTCDPVPGGLLVGQISDANTHGALPSAVITVASTGASGTSAVSQDPALTGAFYSLFAPVGSQTVTAAKAHYTPATRTVAIPSDGVAEADFALKAGRLAVSPNAIAKRLAWATSGTTTLTVKNTGTAPATLNLAENAGGFTIQSPMRPAPVQTVTGTFPKTDMAVYAKNHKAARTAPASPTAGTAWQPIANYPTTVQDNLAEYSGGKLYSGFGFDGTNDLKSLYSYDPTGGAWTALASATDTRETPAHGFIGGKLYVAGGWGPSGNPDGLTEVYDPATNAWSTGPAWSAPLAGSGSAVLGGKLYVVGGCQASTCGTTSVSVLDPATGTWSSASAYPESTSWVACGGVNFKIYCAGGTDGTNTSQHTYAYDPTTDSWTRLADMPTGVWGSAYTAANGELLIQDGIVGGTLTNQGWIYNPASDSWSALPNANAAAYRFGGALGFYTVGGGEGLSATPLNTAAVLPGYDQGGGAGVPWLSLSATSVTVAPGKSAKITVTLNAADPSIVQPGTYTASLLFGSDTPYALAAVPVTLKVSPPATWGKIAGVVQYANASGTLVPIPGATVQVDTWATHYTLHTDSTGHYALWLDYRNNPLTVIVAKDGYQPQVATVNVRKGATVTTNFTLLKD